MSAGASQQGLSAAYSSRLSDQFYDKKGVQEESGRYYATQKMRFCEDQYNGVKVKGNIFPIHVMKAYCWTGGITPLILNIGNKWR